MFNYFSVREEIKQEKKTFFFLKHIDFICKALYYYKASLRHTLNSEAKKKNFKKLLTLR